MLRTVSCSALLLFLPALGGCQAAQALFKSSGKSGPMVDGMQFGRWTYRYPSGAKQAEGLYDKDKQTGRWTYWFEKGSVEWEGGFEDQRISGPCLFGYESGARRAVGHFVNGFEEDLWSFWTPLGALEQEGDFARGRATLRWSYFHPDGSLLAQGFRLDGERAGLWQFHTPDGELSERRFPMPEGAEVVHETWDDSAPRREGWVMNGVPSGRWATWHPNGRRRLTYDLEGGALHGLVLAWSDTGARLAQGQAEHGAPAGTWTLWRGGVAERVSAERLRGGTFGGEWSREGAPAAVALEAALARWIAEAASPCGETVDQTPDPDTAAPPAEYVALTESTPSIPIRPQPWTVREGEALEFLVARYSDGARTVRPPARSAYGSRRRAGGNDRGSSVDTGDPELSARFLGTSLPWTRFRRGDTSIVDMDDFRGKKKVVLVVLRGFAREVCVYCVTQTEALCDNAEAFRAEGCEVFVVYPGERNRLEAFMQSFRELSKQEGEPPIGVLYDPDMQLVERMGIAAELAIPSTFVIDEGGVIRYSYVGREIDDRPPAQDVLAAVKALPHP